MREPDPLVQLFRASLALLSAVAVAACGASAPGSSDAGSKQDSYYPATTVSIPLDPGCQNEPLVDTNPNVPGVQPRCQVLAKVPCNTPGAGACHADGYTSKALTECLVPATGLPPDPESPRTQDIPDNGRPCWYLWRDDDACPNTFSYQRISVLEKAGVVSAEGSLLELTCLFCTGVPCPAIDLQN